jgi:hypothetical protein
LNLYEMQIKTMLRLLAEEDDVQNCKADHT